MKPAPCAIEFIVIAAPDLAAAKRFYVEVFGFEVADFSPRFATFKAGNISGGFDLDLVPSERSTRISITVDDVAAALARVAQLGGRVVRSRYELAPGAGFSAQFADPNGNVFELYGAV
jgi:uncharacterized protein